tara:strand:+ start:7332 stop:8351 length:1020 start_codon:yes stop_codon:yes gene_type:complete
LNKLQDRLPDEFSLPIDPRMMCCGVKVDKCRVMSSAKLPLWLVFENSDPLGDDVMVMFKAGDDLRQDTMVLQLIRNMDALWRQGGLDLCMSPYRCVATWHDGGMLEIVKNSATTAAIQSQYGGKYGGAFNEKVFDMWLKDNNSGIKKKTKGSKKKTKKKNVEIDHKLEAARLRFVRSCAGYCVATHVMGIGDRHNDNIMIKKNGQYFHIDFGHFLGNFKYAKGGIRRERTSFVFTKEMKYAMKNGQNGNDLFEAFVDTCAEALKLLHENGAALVNMFTLMVPAGMPELASREDIMYLKDMIYKDSETDDMKKTLKDEIDMGLNNWVKRMDNMFHIIKHA